MPQSRPAARFPPLVEPGPELDADQRRRYARHLTLPGIGAQGQRRLAAARVLVVGAGGLGSPVLLYLAAAGVGTIGVLDDDRVDTSNLQRQVLHGVADVGRPKVDSARDRIADLDPRIVVQGHPVRLGASNALDILSGYDLVVDGTDNFPTRYLVADACEILGLPVVWGSIFRFDGQASVFWAGHGPTYRDLFPVPPPPGSVPSCAEGGVLGVLCAAVGSVMATEAVKLICGIGEPLVGRLSVFDALEMSWRTLAVRPDPDRAPVTRLEVDQPAQPFVAAEHGIDVHDLARRLAARAAGEDDFVLVDVREPAEREVVTIPGAVAIPMAELLAAGPAALPDGVPVVLHCRSGARSAQVLAALHAAGRTDVVHVEGGVLAWVREIDPSLPTD